VRISKEKMKFAKGYEQNFSTEIFRIAKVIERRPRPVYEVVDLNETSIVGQFYQEELTPVRISKRTVYKIHKILNKRVRRGITEYFTMVKNADYLGSVTTNPYHFRHYDINYFALNVNGKQIPAEGLALGMDHEKTSVMEYRTLFEGSGIHHSNRGL
jgi:hypothetical protein